MKSLEITDISRNRVRNQKSVHGNLWHVSLRSHDARMRLALIEPEPGKAALERLGDLFYIL